MDIQNPRHVVILIGFIVFTVFTVVLTVRHLLRDREPAAVSTLHKSFLVFFFLSSALAMSLFLYLALDSGEIYGLGSKRSGPAHLDDDPIVYWVNVTLWYFLSVFLIVTGIVILLTPKVENASE